MISFESDYNNGTLPEILEALGKTNDEKTSGYGSTHIPKLPKRKFARPLAWKMLMSASL